MLAYAQRTETAIKSKSESLRSRFCDPAGIRTQDPYIKSVMLYLLSYGIMFLRLIKAKRLTLFIRIVSFFRDISYAVPISKGFFKIGVQI